MGDESRSVEGQPEAEAPPFTVTVDPHFRPVETGPQPERAPVLISWDEVHIAWGESDSLPELLQHCPTGVTLAPAKFGTEDDRHAALAALDELVCTTHERCHGVWQASDE